MVTWPTRRRRHAADAGDARGQRVGGELRVAHADAGGRRRGLVGAHREHPPAEAALAHPRTSRRSRRGGGEQHEAQRGADEPAADRAQARRPRRRPSPRIVGSGIGVADAPTPHVEFVEAELLDRDGGRERHDGEAHAAHAQRGRARRGSPSPSRPHREHRRDREAQRRRRCQVRHGEGRDARERDLHERHLAHVAGDDDERQADDRPGERDGDGVALVEGQDEQRDDDGDDADDAPAAPGAWAGRRRQARLDQLAARRQARPPQPQRDDDDEERQHRVDAGQRRRRRPSGTRLWSARSRGATARPR